jgi:DNA polymerase-3 subunit epsilon
LLDAELLAEVYIELIDARQATLILVENGEEQDRTPQQVAASRVRPMPLAPRLTEAEFGAHRNFIATLGEAAVWNDYRPVSVPPQAMPQEVPPVDIVPVERVAADQAGAMLP